MSRGSAEDRGDDCRTWSRGATPALIWLLFLAVTAAGSEPAGSRQHKSDSSPRRAAVRDSRASRGAERSEIDELDRDRVPPSGEGDHLSDDSAEIEIASAREGRFAGMANESGAGGDPAGDWMSLVESMPVAPSLLAVLALSVVPSLLLMTTCFARFSIVLTLVRQDRKSTRLNSSHSSVSRMPSSA